MGAVGHTAEFCQYGSPKLEAHTLRSSSELELLEALQGCVANGVGVARSLWRGTPHYWGGSSQHAQVSKYL